MKLAAALAALVVAGCASNGTLAKRDRCRAERVGDLIGQLPGETLAVDALRRARATTIEYLLPDRIVTTDYRYGRLRLALGEDGRIAGVSCG